MKPIPKEKIKKILILRPELIGDTLLLTPLISAIKKELPSSEIFLLLQPLATEVVKDNPEVAGCVFTERKKGLSELFELLPKIRKEKFDLALVLEDNPAPEHAFLAFFSGIPYRLGDKNRLLYSWTYNCGGWIDSNDPSAHMVELHAGLLKPLGISRIEEPLKLKLTAKASPLKGQGDLVGIHIGTGGGNRALLPETYAGISDLIQEKLGLKTVLLGGKRELSTLAELKKSARRPFIDLVDKLSLNELFSAISELKLFIGVDSGPLHAAAALQVPTVAVYTANDVKPVRWFPWMCRNMIIKSRNECRLRCSHRECDLDLCLKVIQPAEILRAAESLLKGQGNQDNEETRKAALC